MKRLKIILGSNFGLRSLEDISRIKSIVHKHRSDAAHAVACHNTALYGRSSAPARQERRMNIDTAESGIAKYIFRQQLAVCRNDYHIRRKSFKFFLKCSALKCLRLKKRNTAGKSRRLYRRRQKCVSPALRLIRLCDRTDNLEFFITKPFKRERRKIRRSHKKYLH